MGIADQLNTQLQGLVSQIEDLGDEFAGVIAAEQEVNEKTAASSQSASDADAAASAAATSAGDASSSASEAASSATASDTSAQSASTAASSAESSATTSAQAATSASSSASTANDAASAAAASEDSATTAATNAQTVLAQAQTVLSAAQAAAAQLSGQLQSFNQIWLGDFTEDPTTDNNGDPLIAGAEYLNTSDDPPIIREYVNGAWQDQDLAGQIASQNSALSATQAGASATSASNYASAAAASATQAGTSSTAAANSASAASTSESNAEAAVSDADSAASAAEASATTASDAAVDAEAWATQASGTVDGTNYSAAYNAKQAASSASAAAQSATDAGTYAASMTDSVTDAASSASAADQSASDASASAAAAASSAGSAQNSATAAGNSASDAAGSASSAASDASAASESESNAADSASSASTDATNAAASATAASGDATLAQQWATETSGTVDGTSYGAKYYAQQAAASDADATTQASNADASATAATDSASDAASSATLAKNWATQTGSTVDGSDYSAKYYATNAANSAAAAASSASAVAAQSVTVASNAALAQQWAAQASGNVGGTSYGSALQYAQQASSSATAAAASATDADNAATAAAASAASAQTGATSVNAMLASFKSVWLGDSDTPPTTDLNGDALQNGAEYEDISQDPPVLMVYTADGWVPQDEDAVSSSSNAQLSASQAAASASSASTDADNASSSASAASDSANAAASSATDADNSATAAASSATDAANSADSASTDAGNASSSASDAASYANQAQDSQLVANNNANTAQTAATSAEAWASQASGTVDGTSYSAAYYAKAAAASDVDATTQASNAGTSATLAQNWASLMSETVDGTSYSAKYYASQAASSASSASASVTSAATSESSAVNAANTAEAYSEQSEAWAGQASASASQASTSASNAASDASAAASSESSAASAASSASSSASAASSSATQAQDSQLAAQVSSNSAGTSATSAANSASAAATSAQSAAEAIYTANTVEPISTTGGTTTLTAAEAAAGIYAVTGTLTSNAVIVVPATSHPFIVNNGTTGAYTLTIEMTGGTSVETVPQGESQQLYCDGSGGIFSVSSVSGFQFSGTKSVTASGTKLDSTYAGVMTSVAPSSGSTIYLPPGATMTAGGSVFLDAGSNFTLALQGSDTADFGSTVSVLTKDKWLFTWNGSEWLTTLYSSSFTARFTYSVTTPLVYASARVLIGTVTDDGATSLQSSGGATFGAPVMVPTQPAGDNTLAAANTAFVHAAIAAIVASSPSTLDTLNELASALGDDANFSTTITNLIATKAALSGASFTGNVSAPLLTATSGAVWASGYGGNANEGVVFLGSGGGTYLYYDGVKYNLPLAELYVNSYQAWHAGNFTPSNYAALAGSADFAGTVTGTGSSYALRAVNLTTGQTSIGLTHEGAATDQKNWEFIFGTDGSIGCRAVNDAYTLSQYAWQVVRSATSYTLAVLELMGQGGRVLVGATSDDGTNILQVDGSVRAANLYINTQAVTDSGIAGFSNSNGPAVAFYGSGTTGVGSLVLRTDGLERARINAAGRMLLGTTTDDGSNLLQVDGGVRSLVGGFTYPDGTIQTTANVSSNPTAIDYTPASGTTTFAVQQYGVGLVQVFANGSRLSNTTGYTATTGNSITLLTAADGNTTYSVLTGVLYEATNLLQPIVQAVAVAVGVKTLTLPASALAGYLWVFQNGAWLVPGVDFTFTGGATATLTTAPTQATDVFTVVILQPVSFTNSATQAQVQTGGMTFVTDTGVANAYAAAYIPAVGAPTHGMRLSFIVKTTNTGASTLAANGGTAYAIYGGGHVALTGGELVVGAYVTVMYNATLGAWVIVENTLGRQQYGSGVNIVGLGGRITADMSNATYSNQLAFQTSTTNGNTTVNAIPNGTGAASQFIAWAAAVQTNSPYLSMGVSTASGFSYINSGALGTGTALPLTFDVNGAERMRIDTSGRVLIGTATSATIGGFGGQHQIVSSVNVTRQFIQGHANGLGYGTVYLNGAEGGGGCQALTFANSSGAAVGTVTVTTSATAYNTTSDYRLKENIAPMTGALKRLMLAKLVRFSFKNDPNKRVVDGFLAHEIAQLVPEAVHGEKDAVWHHLTMREGHDPKDIKQDDVLDVKAEIVAQQVDYSKLVPLLMASVQELTAEVRASHNAMVAMQKQITALKNEVASYRKR